MPDIDSSDFTPVAPNTLLASARRAYEFGRLKRGLALSGLLAALALVTVLGAERRGLAVLGGIGLAALALILRWRGRAWGRALMPGLIMGLLPFLAPIVFGGGPGSCHDGCCTPLCATACTVAGALSGAFLGLLARGSLWDRLTFGVGGAGVAWLVGLVGCGWTGTGHFAGMALGLAGGALLSLPRFRKAVA